MNELHVTLGDRTYSFGPGETVRIGRSPDNDIVVGDPTVSRQHARLSCGPDGWEWENVGRALSFLDGQPVSRARLSLPASVQLASDHGPVLGMSAGASSSASSSEADRTSILENNEGWPEADAGGHPGAAGAGLDPAAGAGAAGGLADDLLGLGLGGGAGVPAADPLGPGSLADPAAADPGVPGLAVPGPGAGPYGTQQAAPADASQTAWEGAPDGQREVPRVRPVSAPPVDEIATALHILVPIRSWLHDPGWRQFVRLLVIPYGLLPLVFIALFASSNDLSTPGWAYSLYIAPLWGIVFWLLIRPGPVGRREIGIAAGSIGFALIWIRIVTIHINGLMGKAGRPLSFPGALGVGINEEITKALPIFVAAILLLRMRQIKLDVRMWMFLGTLVGLAFGVTEQAGYTTLDIEGISAAKANSQAIVEVLAFAERVFVDGFQHAMWAGVSAFFIGMAINYPRRRIQLIAFGIAVPAVLHGLYDWSAGAFASLWVPIMVQALSLFLFLGYTMSAAAIERQVRQTPMFRGESMLMERISDQQLSRQRPPRS